MQEHHRTNFVAYRARPATTASNHKAACADGCESGASCRGCLDEHALTLLSLARGSNTSVDSSVESPSTFSAAGSSGSSTPRGVKRQLSDLSVTNNEVQQPGGTAAQCTTCEDAGAPSASPSALASGARLPSVLLPLSPSDTEIGVLPGGDHRENIGFRDRR